MVGAWLGHAARRLGSAPGVVSSSLSVEVERDEPAEGPSQLAYLDVDVVIDGQDDEAAALVVERTVVDALFDVLGDREAGWTAYEWFAEPFAT